MEILIGLAIGVGVVYGMIVSRPFRAAVLIVAGGFAMLMWMWIGDPFGLKQARDEELARQVEECYQKLPAKSAPKPWEQDYYRKADGSWAATAPDWSPECTAEAIHKREGQRLEEAQRQFERAQKAGTDPWAGWLDCPQSNRSPECEAARNREKSPDSAQDDY
jgi:hypothetical protein